MLQIKQPVMIGFVYGLMSFVISFLLFKDLPRLIGISTVLFVVILITPRINKLIEHEEELKEKKKTFYEKHKNIINFYLYFFTGLFLAFFLISALLPELVFSQRQLYGIDQRYEKITMLFPPMYESTVNGIMLIFKNNIYVMLIAFFLSVFAGAGSIFLVSLNASVFAAAIAEVIRYKIPISMGFFLKYGIVSCNLGLMLIHTVPETAAYLVAAIAGGILGKAIQKEEIKSEKFKSIIKECLKFLLVAVVVTFIAAIMEVAFTEKMIYTRTCVTNPYVVGAMTLVIIFALLIFQVYWVMIKRK